MSPNRSVADLVAFLDRARSVSVIVIADGNDDDTPVIQKLALHEDVADSFRQTARRAVPILGEHVVLRDYDPGYKPEPYELCRLPLRDVPEIATLCSDIGRVDLAENFGADDETIERLRFYTIVIGGTQGRQALFIRAYGPKKELSRRGGYAITFRQGTYNHVREKVFLFDDAVDCFSWDGSLYILNPDKFQRIFRYFERLRAAAEGTIRGIATRVPVRNLDEFVDAVKTNSLMSAKVASIARKPYLPRVTMTDIRRTIDEFELAVQVDSAGGVEQLVFEPTREKRWLILKLLDDDYLGSIMTREKYEVNSKSRL